MAESLVSEVLGCFCSMALGCLPQVAAVPSLIILQEIFLGPSSQPSIYFKNSSRALLFPGAYSHMQFHSDQVITCPISSWILKSLGHVSSWDTFLAFPQKGWVAAPLHFLCKLLGGNILVRERAKKLKVTKI